MAGPQRSGVEDAALLHLELGVGEHALLLELAELLELLQLALMSSPAAARRRPAGGGAGGCADCCCSYCCWSCAPQRPAWRRETRFDTAVAVPATTAVLATPLSRPGMINPFLLCWRLVAIGSAGRLVDRVQRRQEGLHGDPPARHELSAGASHR